MSCFDPLILRLSHFYQNTASRMYRIDPHIFPTACPMYSFDPPFSQRFDQCIVSTLFFDQSIWCRILRYIPPEEHAYPNTPWVPPPRVQAIDISHWIECLYMLISFAASGTDISTCTHAPGSLVCDISGKMILISTKNAETYRWVTWFVLSAIRTRSTSLLLNQ